MSQVSRVCGKSGHRNQDLMGRGHLGEPKAEVLGESLNIERSFSGREQCQCVKGSCNVLSVVVCEFSVFACPRHFGQAVRFGGHVHLFCHFRCRYFCHNKCEFEETPAPKKAWSEKRSKSSTRQFLGPLFCTTRRNRFRLKVLIFISADADETRRNKHFAHDRFRSNPPQGEGLCGEMGTQGFGASSYMGSEKNVDAR